MRVSVGVFNLVFSAAFTVLLIVHWAELNTFISARLAG